MKLSVIIVSFNQFKYLKAAIDALKTNPPPFAYEIIVVDNHSTDDIQEFLNDYFYDIIIIQNRSNHGFGWANNRGAAMAKGEYLLFLNSDAEVIDNAVESMVQIMEKDRQIGALGPMLLNTDDSFQLSFGPKISLIGEFYQKTMAPVIEKWKCSGSHSDRICKKTAWVSGACLLIRKEVFSGQPPFDENMFLYFEDHDLCLRVLALGKKVIYYGGARVRHHGGRSMAIMTGKVLEYRKSQLYLYKKQRMFISLFLLKKYLKLKYSIKIKKASLPVNKSNQAEIEVFNDILKLL